MQGSIYSLARKLKRTNYPGKALVNSMYHDPEYIPVKIKNFDYVVVDGYKFLVNDQMDSIQRVEGNSWFKNMRPTDVGVDIGANIGAITIPMAKKMRKVYAVEPLFTDILKKNIELNGLTNVEVMEFGIARRDGWREVEFSSRRGKMRTHTLEYVRYIIKEPIDWLKMDGEGCEWEMPLCEVLGIREIRIEFHIRRGEKKEDYKKFEALVGLLGGSGYRYEITRGAVPGPCVPFSECILLNASREE